MTIAPTFSIIIPNYKDDLLLERLLRDIARFFNDFNLEVLVVDGEGRDCPIKFSSQNCYWIKGEHGRGPQILNGLLAARGRYIWVLHADSQPSAQGLTEIDTILSDPSISLGMFHLSFHAMRHPAYRFFESFARFDTVFSSFGDQGFFFRRSDFDAHKDMISASLKTHILLEDVALRRLFLQWGRVKKSRLPLISSARRFQRLGIWKTQIKNIKILYRYFKGHKPKALYDAYYQTAPQTYVSYVPPNTVKAL